LDIAMAVFFQGMPFEALGHSSADQQEQPNDDMS
jgi:hypothetical protein